MTPPQSRPDDRVWVTVLAGGIGSRFWPASTPAAPKPLLALASDRPLLVDTLERARRLAPRDRIRILAGSHLVAPFTGAATGLEADDFWIEPAARGTGPVLAWAAWKALQADPDAVLVSLHSDHVIEPVEAFVGLIHDAVAVADDERCLVTIGAVPDRPETGYGYLQPGASLADGRARRVDAFHEKPDPETAARYLAEGFLWNTGIFVWRADVLLDEVRAHAPEIAAALPRLDEGGAEAFFADVASISVDVAVLERSTRVACLASTFQWDDVGTWDALARTRGSDAAGNVVVGPGRIVDGRGNLVWSDGPPVVLWGVEDLVTVQANGVTLVFPRDRAPDLKKLLAELPDEWTP
jgi:mannose-1-phosphate guanylyltransferase